MQVNHALRIGLSADGNLIAITTDGRFGQLTINERKRKINFAMRGKIHIENGQRVWLQECRFEQ